MRVTMRPRGSCLMFDMTTPPLLVWEPSNLKQPYPGSFQHYERNCQEGAFFAC